MVRNIVLRISTGMAVALTAGAVLVATGPTATATQDQPVIDGQTNYATYPTVIGSTAGGDGLDAYAGSVGSGVVGTGGLNGVSGLTSNDAASGVYGENDGAGFGVAGRAVSGTGVLADSANGTALQVKGRSRFSTAGTAVIASGKKSVTVSLAGVTTTDFVLATVQGSGAFYVKNASVGNGQFTIFINKAPTAPGTVVVAYFVISAS